MFLNYHFLLLIIFSIQIVKYNHLITSYCFFFAIRLCSDRQNTSLYHKARSPETRVSNYLVLWSNIRSYDFVLIQSLGNGFPTQPVPIFANVYIVTPRGLDFLPFIVISSFISFHFFIHKLNNYTNENLNTT